MKYIKQTIKLLGIILTAILIAGTAYLYSSGPILPEETDDIIESTIATQLPHLILGNVGFADNKGVNIWYESIENKDSCKGAILLIMGISNDAMGWPPNFIQAFVDEGYQVIRYDHRGTGMSDWMNDWESTNPYSITDMANDAVSVLDALKIDKATIVGVSMGGMIAQEMAVHHPDRVKSLTSIMSSGFIQDPNLPPISSNVAEELIKVGLKYGIVGGEKNLIKLHLASRKILMGNAIHDLNTKSLAQQTLYNIRKRKGYNPKVSKQHQVAVSISGSRYEDLMRLDIPSLIIHGKLDPFIPIEHGQKCASLIPNSDSLWIDNMGHDIPDVFINTIAKRIIENEKRVL